MVYLQKMLAHRVSQAYGLQTSTVDYEEGPGRVIGTRTAFTRIRPVRIIIELSPQVKSDDVPIGSRLRPDQNA